MGVEIRGMDELRANLEIYRQRKIVKAPAALRLAGQAYANDVKELAPYKTGTYRRSIHVDDTIMSDQEKPTVIVGTDLPYARRLEYGFFGMTDSLGRTFHQVPQPHFRPPLDTEMEKYKAIMRGELVDEQYDGPAGENWAANIISGAGVRPDLFAGAFSE